MSEMKLIMEGWRGFLEENNSHDYPVHVLNENKDKVKTVNLSTLKEHATKGLITEEKLMEMWFDSAEYEWEQLINEGVLDVLKKGATAMKKGVEWAGEKVVQAYRAATEKIRNFWIEVYIRGIDLLQRTVGKIKSAPVIKQFLGGMGKMINKAKEFREDHPVLTKVIIITAALAAVAAVMVITSSDAEASIKIGKGPVESGNEEIWQGAKGICAAAYDTAELAEKQVLADCVQLINDYSPGGIHAGEVLNIQDMSNESHAIIVKARALFGAVEEQSLKDMRGVKKLYDSWVAAGEPGGEQYQQVMSAFEAAKDMREATKDIIELGQNSTYKVEEIIKWSTEGGENVRIQIGGAIPKIAQAAEKGVIDEPGIVRNIGKMFEPKQ